MESKETIRTLKPKAKLDDGCIVEYDYCCLAGTDPKFGPEVSSKYLGRGTIYEVLGVQQRYTSADRYYDFWDFIN